MKSLSRANLSKEEAVTIAADSDILNNSGFAINLLIHSVNNINQCVTITDLNNKLIFVNQAFLALYGYTEKEIIGKSISIIKADKEISLDYDSNNIHSTSLQVEFINRKKDGTHFPAFLETSAVNDEKGNPTAVVRIITNLAERKKSEKDQKRKNNDLEFINSIAFKLAELPSDRDLAEFLTQQIKKFTRAAFVIFSEYDDNNNALIIRQVEASHFLLRMVIALAGKNILNTVSPVSKEIYNELISITVGIRNSFVEISFGAIPETVDKALRIATGLNCFYGVAFVLEGELFGTSVLAFKDNQEKPSLDMLRSFANLAAVSLRRRKAEDKFKDSELQFRTLFDNAVLGIYRSTPDGRVIMINQALCRMLGFSSEKELMERNLEKEGFQPNYPRSDFKERFKDNNDYNIFESSWTKADGSVIFVKECAKAVRDPSSGNVLYYDGTVEDITVSKMAQEALIHSEKKYRFLFEKSPLPMWICELETFKFLDVNKTAVDHYGYSKEEFFNLTIKDLRPQSDLEEFMNSFTKTFDVNIKTSNWRHLKKNGEIIYVEIFSQSIEYEGNIARLVISNDVTERKKLQDTLILAKNEAEKSNGLKSEFLAQMSHEIRSPISTMLNFISLIKDDLPEPLSEDMVFNFNVINNSSRRLIRTIDLILNMSQIQTGNIKCEYQDIDLVKNILNNMLDEYNTSAALKGLDLNICNECDIAIINVDPYSVTQIFSNLISNAITYTNTGVITIKIYRDHDKNICVDVSDTGIGISEEYIKNIFTPFSQEQQGYSRKYEGNGLGLALVKKYCELNNAKISVKSIKGEGSVFTVIFSSSIL
jgi:PAS domain S-box-containing protein